MEYPELEGIGLTKSEILVYTTLLKIGSSSTGRIVKVARISSGKIYEILGKLIEKGLVSYILRNNVKYFSASEPYKIREYVEKKKQDIEEKEGKINELLPELEKLRKFVEYENSAEIFMGVNGFKTALTSLIDDMQKDNELLSLGGSGIRKPEINIIWKKAASKLKERGIRSRFLVTDISKKSKSELETYKKISPDFNYRFSPGFHLAPIIIGKNQILIINFKQLSAIVIKNKTIANQFKFFFESLWKTGFE
jgi:sugar-specific transcriptional regulator TrmB